jgi:hypothetical protein
VKALVGFAGDGAGRGIAYLRMRRGGKERVARRVFRFDPHPGFVERSTGYAAMEAMLPLLRKHARRVDIELDDVELFADLTQQREIPVALMLPYVRVRCGLNAFESWTLGVGMEARDLTARSRAEVSLPTAA